MDKKYICSFLEEKVKGRDHFGEMRAYRIILKWMLIKQRVRCGLDLSG
jgi:hypothetical protein